MAHPDEMNVLHEYAQLRREKIKLQRLIKNINTRLKELSPGVINMMNTTGADTIKMSNVGCSITKHCKRKVLPLNHDRRHQYFVTFFNQLDDPSLSSEDRAQQLESLLDNKETRQSQEVDSISIKLLKNRQGGMLPP
jgi:hypothetical protein